MSSGSQIGRALSGALALARFDRKGMERFDFSVDGFWRSFNAIAVCLPVVLFFAVLSPGVMEQLAAESARLAGEAPSPPPVPQQPGLALVFETLGFLAGWAFFPLGMIWIARKLDLGSRYVPLIVSVNWCRVIGAYVLRLPLLLYAAGLIDFGVVSLLWFLSVIWLAVYFWFVIRLATQTSGITAFGLLLFDMVGTALVQGLVAQLYWLIEPAAPVPENT